MKMNNDTQPPFHTWLDWMGHYFDAGKINREDLETLIAKVNDLEAKLPQDEQKFTKLQSLIENDIPSAFTLQQIIEIILQPVYLAIDPNSGKTVIETYPSLDSRVLTATLIAMMNNAEDYEALYSLIQEAKSTAEKLIAN